MQLDRTGRRRVPVASANSVSPSNIVCTGRIARARPSWPMPATLAHCALVSVASVAMTPIVVLPSTARRPSAGRPPAARIAPAPCGASASGSGQGRTRRRRTNRRGIQLPGARVDGDPAALTTTSAATVVPRRSTRLADPMPPLSWPATGARAGSDAALRDGPPVARPRRSAADRRACASGAARKSPPRPRSKMTAAGHDRHDLAGPAHRKAEPPSASPCITPSAAASPNALPPVSTTAWTRSTALRGSRRSVSRVPGPPPRTSTPPTAPPVRASTTVVPDSQPSPGGWRPDPDAGHVDEALAGPGAVGACGAPTGQERRAASA